MTDHDSELDAYAALLTEGPPGAVTLEQLTALFLNAKSTELFRRWPDGRPMEARLVARLVELAELARRRAIDEFGVDLVQATGSAYLPLSRDGSAGGEA